MATPVKDPRQLLFDAFLTFAQQEFKGQLYEKPRSQSADPKSMYIRIRLPKEHSYVSMGMVLFLNEEDAIKACETFVSRRNQAFEIQANCPGRGPQVYTSPSFLEENRIANSRRLQIQRKASLLWQMARRSRWFPWP